MANRPVQVDPVHQESVPRIGALVSGMGRSVLNLHAAIQQGTLRAQIALVIATSPDVPALERCRAAGLATQVVPAEPAHTFDDRIDAELFARGVSLVCLCGYLRHFRVAAWKGRALNVHPSLLPEFGGRGMYGARVHNAVLQSGRSHTGCTVHWVDEQYDHGPALVQLACPVLPGDTADTLAERVFQLECAAYPAAIQRATQAAAHTT